MKSVFLSSTIDEFAQEREMISRVLESIGHRVYRFEATHSAASSSPEELYIENVKRADACVFLLGRRFSQVVLDEELYIARRQNVPCLIFICDFKPGERERKLAIWLESSLKNPNSETFQFVHNEAALVPLVLKTVAETFASPEQASSPPPQAQAIPRQYISFVGRNEEVNLVQQRILKGDRHAAILIHGLGGIGKSAVAYRIATKLLEEGTMRRICWIDCRQVRIKDGQKVHDAEVQPLDSILAAFFAGIDRPHLARAKHKDKLAYFDKAHGNSGTIVVFDNAESVTNFELTVPKLVSMFGAGVQLLLTSRHQYPSQKIQPVKLGPMNARDAREFLRVIAADRELLALRDADDETCRRISESVGGSPLAMQWVAGQLEFLPLSSVLNAISSRDPQSDELYRHVFSASWNQLRLNAKKMIVALVHNGLCDGANLAEIQAVTGLSGSDLIDGLKQLVTMSLLDKYGVVGAERYSAHELTRYYVGNQTL
jgi:hypothetical protein